MRVERNGRTWWFGEHDPMKPIEEEAKKTFLPNVGWPWWISVLLLFVPSRYIRDDEDPGFTLRYKVLFGCVYVVGEEP